MITAHPTTKAVDGGFIPMITFRGERGQMRGSATPKGQAREWRTFTTQAAAEAEAYVIALRCALAWPNAIRVAE